MDVDAYRRNEKISFKRYFAAFSIDNIMNMVVDEKRAPSRLGRVPICETREWADS